MVKKACLRVMLAHVSEQLVDEPAHERPRRVNAGNQLRNHLQATHIIYGKLLNSNMNVHYCVVDRKDLFRIRRVPYHTGTFPVIPDPIQNFGRPREKNTKYKTLKGLQRDFIVFPKKTAFCQHRI
jgi:hypothetical protein